MLGSFRLCNVSAAAGGSDGRELQLRVSPQPFLFIMSAFCLITAHLQPGRRCMLPSTGRGGRGGSAFINLYLDLRGGQRKKSSWKRGAFIIFEPITITVSAKPTIVQVFQNRHFGPSAAPRNADIWFIY